MQPAGQDSKARPGAWNGYTTALFGEECQSSTVVTPTIPDRPQIRKPRDKAKAEVAVQIVQRFVLARLRNRRFFSIEELNVAIRECVAELNASHAQTRQEPARAV